MIEKATGQSLQVSDSTTELRGRDRFWQGQNYLPRYFADHGDPPGWRSAELIESIRAGIHFPAMVISTHASKFLQKNIADWLDSFPASEQLPRIGLVGSGDWIVEEQYWNQMSMVIDCPQGLLRDFPVSADHVYSVGSEFGICQGRTVKDVITQFQASDRTEQWLHVLLDLSSAHTKSEAEYLLQEHERFAVPYHSGLWSKLQDLTGFASAKNAIMTARPAREHDLGHQFMIQLEQNKILYVSLEVTRPLPEIKSKACLVNTGPPLIPEPYHWASDRAVSVQDELNNLREKKFVDTYFNRHCMLTVEDREYHSRVIEMSRIREVATPDGRHLGLLFYGLDQEHMHLNLPSEDRDFAGQGLVELLTYSALSDHPQYDKLRVCINAALPAVEEEVKRGRDRVESSLALPYIQFLRDIGYSKWLERESQLSDSGSNWITLERPG